MCIAVEEKSLHRGLSSCPPSTRDFSFPSLPPCQSSENAADPDNHAEVRGLCGIAKKTKTSWPESASELYRPGDRVLSAKLVPIFSGRSRHVVSVTDSYGHILGFLD
jgi:hypothetical protein